jgi:hypothetical protein
MSKRLKRVGYMQYDKWVFFIIAALAAYSYMANYPVMDRPTQLFAVLFVFGPLLAGLYLLLREKPDRTRLGKPHKSG